MNNHHRPNSQVIEAFAPAEKSAIVKGERTEVTRNLIAVVFISSYLVLLMLLIGLSAFSKLPENVSKDYLLAIGTPLGFILGYYFKSSKN